MPKIKPHASAGTDIPPAALDKIRNRLAGKPRDRLLFDMTTQTDLPARSWLRLKVKQLIDLDIGDPLPASIISNNSGNRPTMNAVLHESLRQFVLSEKLSREDFLFRSRKGDNPLSLPSVSRIVKNWFKDAGIDGKGALRLLRGAWDRRQDAGTGPMARKNDKRVLEPLAVTTLQEAVYKKLEGVILAGHIQPGERIVADGVAKQLNVSKIPVREALGRLQARGFISTIPNWGHVVTRLSRKNLEEIIELRIDLECLAARKAAALADKETLRRLRTSHEAYAAARNTNNPEELFTTNKEFHYTIYRAAEMPMLLNLIDQLWDKASPYYHIAFRQSPKAQPKIGVSYHHNMLLAMSDGDAEGIAHWLEVDLIDSAKFILGLFK